MARRIGDLPTSSMVRRRLGDPTLPLGYERRVGRPGHRPLPQAGEEIIDLGAECARLVQRDGWDAQPEWCRSSSGDPGYAARRRGVGSVPGSLGWVPPSVHIAGIPNPVAGPTVSDRTWRRVRIGKNERGTIDTMRLMCEMALEAATDPTFVEDARSVARSCPARDYACVAEADIEFMRARVRYTEGSLGTDPDGSELYQWLQSPGYLLYVSGQGLCADFAALGMALAVAQGLKGSIGARSVFLDPSRPRGASHVYAMWNGLAIDPVPPRSRLGDEPPRSSWVAPPLDIVCAQG